MERKILLAENLKQLRKKAGFSRRELAQKISYTDKAIEKWESGHSIPPLPVLCRLAEELGVGLEALVFENSQEIRYFLGIDGGGTKTAFRLESLSGELVEQCELGPSNPNDVGMERCGQILRTGIAEVTAGIPLREVAAFAGLAGGISGNNRELIRKKLNQFDFGAVENGSDIDNALELCLGDGDGVTVVAGTGSIAYAQNRGARHRVGGWGYLLDSGGSGYHLGRDALEVAYRARDGRGNPSVLPQLLERKLEMTLEQAVPILYDGGKRGIAALAPVLFEACDMGDPEALAILRKNCEYLAELIRTADQFVEDKTAPVVICGGLTNRTDLLERYLRPMLDGFPLRFCDAQIVLGAVRRARRNYEQHGKTE